MSLARHNPRRDSNETAIVRALEAAGFSVQRLSGKGVPDLLIGRQGRMWLAEVKAEDGVLTFDQKVWWLNWQGPSPVLLTTIEDVQQFVAASPVRED